MFWSTRPFVRALFFLLAGILLGYFLPIDFSLYHYLTLIAFLSLFLLLSIIWVNTGINKKRQWIQGITIGLMLTLTGVLLITAKVNSDVQAIDSRIIDFTAEVVNEPMPTQQSLKMLLKIKPLNKEELNKQSIRILAFLEKNEDSEALKFGDQLLFHAHIGEPKEPMNPGEFDYKKYLALNGIYYTVYIPSDKWEFIDHVSPNPIITTAIQLRNYLLEALKENGLAEREYAVAAAILLGYDNLMDTELEQDFVTAGAMHILCVSGLHVGVIYLVLNLLFGFLRRNYWQRIVKSLILLFFVWAYAMLTGLSPSVQRAAVMISIFIIGNTFNRQRDAYNTLAASAFLLLLIDPLLIFNLGFQLSYSAVLGILTFHRPLYLLFYFKNPIVDKLWSVTVLSVAAQLGTFPLAAHYFHFFPTYFWLTNLFIFPLSFLIITVGMAFISVSWIPFVSKLVGLALSGLVFLLNQIVGLVKYLPLHGINDLYFPWLKVVIVYTLILLLYFMFIKKNIRLVLPVLSVVFVLIFTETIHEFNILKQKKMVVYSINRNSAYDFIQGDRHILLVDTVLLKKEINLDYYLCNSRIYWGLDTTKVSIEKPNTENDIGLFFDGEFAAFGNFKVAFVDAIEGHNIKKYKKINLDAVFVKGNKFLKLKNLYSYFEVDQLVLDASVPVWKCKKIENEAKRLDLNIHNVRNEGAFIRDLSGSEK